LPDLEYLLPNSEFGRSIGQDKRLAYPFTLYFKEDFLLVQKITKVPHHTKSEQCRQKQKKGFGNPDLIQKPKTKYLDEPNKPFISQNFGK
jgi:hypothetical protein